MKKYLLLTDLESTLSSFIYPKTRALLKESWKRDVWCWNLIYGDLQFATEIY